MITLGDTMITYILSDGKRFYCGRTKTLEDLKSPEGKNLSRRLFEHEKDRYKNYEIVFQVQGYYEKEIKRFGVKKFYLLICEVSRG